MIEKWYKIFPLDELGPGDYFLWGIGTGMFLMQLIIYWPML